MGDKYPYLEDVSLPSASEFLQRHAGKWSDYYAYDDAYAARGVTEYPRTAPAPLALENKQLERRLLEASIALAETHAELNDAKKAYGIVMIAAGLDRVRLLEANAKLEKAEALAAKGLEFAKRNDLLVDENEDLKATVAYLKNKQ